MSNELCSVDAERAVLGSLLLDASMVVPMCELAQLTPEDFSDGNNASIYRAIMSVNAQGRGVDIVVVSDWMANAHLPECGKYLRELIDDTPSSTNAQWYVDIVRGKATARRLLSYASDMQRRLQAGEEPEIVRADVECALAEMTNSSRTLQTTDEAIAEARKGWEQAAKKGCAGLPSGFQLLDKYFGGLMDGALYILSGEPGTGKTTLARNIAENVAEAGVGVAFFSMEQTCAQIWGAVLAKTAKQSVFLLNCGSHKVDHEKIADAIPSVRKLPIYVDDMPQTLTSLWSSSRRLISKQSVGLIVVDYLQRLRAERSYDGDTQKISDYSIRLADMAKDLRIPTLVISSLSREGKLRGSGQLDYDAWAHVKLMRSEQWTPEHQIVDVSFEKQRFGPAFQSEQLELLGNEQRFASLSVGMADNQGNWNPDEE